MRIRLTVGRVVLVDLTVCEFEEPEQPEPLPTAFHDISVGHDIGFSLAPGWIDPVPDEEERGGCEDATT